jgi:hypothetical protein
VKIRDHLGDLGVDGTIILKQVLKKQCVSVDWIYVDQDWYPGTGLVNTKMNIKVPEKGL